MGNSPKTWMHRVRANRGGGECVADDNNTRILWCDFGWNPWNHSCVKRIMLSGAAAADFPHAQWFGSAYLTFRQLSGRQCIDAQNDENNGPDAWSLSWNPPPSLIGPCVRMGRAPGALDRLTRRGGTDTGRALAPRHVASRWARDTRGAHSAGMEVGSRSKCTHSC